MTPSADGEYATPTIKLDRPPPITIKGARPDDTDFHGRVVELYARDRATLDQLERDLARAPAPKPLEAWLSYAGQLWAILIVGTWVVVQMVFLVCWLGYEIVKWLAG